jgi:C_GCAxxG_C_C family probable redox protein
MSDASEAVELFENGFACSQAILAVYGRAYGLDRPTAMRIASCFAGGMRMGETCGAVTGAFMVLGLKHCSSDCGTADRRRTAYTAVREFAARFVERNGTLVCRELLGCDVSTPEGMKQAKDNGLFRTICPQLVRDAGEILEEMEK